MKRTRTVRSLLESLARDLRFAARFLRRNPAFTAAAIGTLALGIGANTAIFSATYGIALKPLPFPRASTLVAISAVQAGTIAIDRPRVSMPAMDDLGAQSHSFDQIARCLTDQVTLTGRLEPLNLTGMEVSGDFFAVYGTPPLLGRPIVPADTEPAHDRVVVLSYELWQRSFGGDPAVIGTAVDLAVQPSGMFIPNALSATPRTIVGVMPPHQRFAVDGDLWVPLTTGTHGPSMGRSPRAWRNVEAVGRLAAGVTLDDANRELHTIAAHLATEYPTTDQDWDLRVVPLLDVVTEGYRSKLFLLFSAVTLVLLLACVSVGSLILARNRARQQDVVIRESLGATRARLVQQMLAESVLLALAGGAVGLLLAYWSVHVLRGAAPAGTPRVEEIALNGPVLAYTLGASLVCGILLGLAPAMRLTRPELSSMIKMQGAGSRRAWLPLPFRRRGGLIAAQIALVFPLVVGSILTLRSLDKLVHIDVGYRRDHILVMSVKLSRSTCATFDACSATITEILDRTRAVGGVEYAAFTGTRPFGMSFATPVTIEGESAEPSDRAAIAFQTVTPDYFRTMGISMRGGRPFDDRDGSHAPLVAIVNHAFGRRDFQGAALGKRFQRAGRPSWLEVVGEVGDARDVNLSQAPQPTFYIPLAQAEVILQTNLLVRTAGTPLTVAPLVRQQIVMVDKNAPVRDLETMDQVMSDSLADRRFQTLLLTTFAGLAVVLALLGIYGLISYAVSERFHEFGVRMALGAQSRDIMGLVLRDGVSAVGGGLAVGVCAALALTRFLRSLLFDITAADPVSFVSVGVLVMLVVLVAYFLPARRAARVDPLAVLRHQ